MHSSVIKTSRENVNRGFKTCEKNAYLKGGNNEI